MKQYERDYGSLEDVMLLAGKSEYKCKANPDVTAELWTIVESLHANTTTVEPMIHASTVKKSAHSWITRLL